MRPHSVRRLAIAALALTLLALTTASATMVATGRHSVAVSGSYRPHVAATGSGSRPNIVLILVDDMAERDLEHMPKVRALLGDEGTTFANSFTPFSLCCPDRTSILTGQYAHNHGVLGNDTPKYPLGGYPGFHTDDNTLATWLDDAGYQTAFVGKYLNRYAKGGAPARVPPGWDDWHATKALHYDTVPMYENGADTVHRGVYATDLVTGMSDRIIASTMSRAEPLFLWTSYFAPHAGDPKDPDDTCTGRGAPRSVATPSPSPRDRDDFAGLRLPDDPSFNEADVSDKPAAIRRLARLSPTMVGCLAELNRQRIESLQSVDRGVSKIVAAVTAAGEIDNTVFVFTSDNGYLIGQHRVPQGKVLPYEPSIRVPLIVRGPGFAAGAVHSQLTATVDLAPTLADLAGATPRRIIDGISLLPGSGLSEHADRDIVLEAGPKTVKGPMTFTGLRTERYKYVEYATGERELYDLRSDPYELRNLAGDPAVADIEQKLAAELAAVRNCAGRMCDVETPGF
jgi:N-acetylglucosamine-6-sulfatase